MTLERHDAWASWELQVLYDLVHEQDWIDEAVELLPARSRKAIEVRMSLLRSEAEITPRKAGPRALWSDKVHNDRTIEASRKLADALLGLDELAAPALSENERREADTLAIVSHELVDGRVELQLEFFNGPLFEWAEAA